MALPEPLARFVSKLQLQALPGAPRPPPEASITRTQLVASTSSSSSSGPAMQASSKRKAFFSDDVDVGTAPEVLSQETVEAAPLISHDTLRLMFSGGIAGALSKTCTAPLARLTILYQAGGVVLGGSGAWDEHLGSWPECSAWGFRQAAGVHHAGAATGLLRDGTGMQGPGTQGPGATPEAPCLLALSLCLLAGWPVHNAGQRQG